MKKSALLSLVLALAMLLSACAGTDASSASTASSAVSVSAPASEAQAEEALRLEDDYYRYINSAWLEAASIPADSASVNAFSEIQDGIDKQLSGDMREMAASDAPQDDPLMEQMVEYYRQAADYDARNEVGIAPLAAALVRVENYVNLEQMKHDIPVLLLDSVSFPLNFAVSPDIGDSTTNVLYAGGADLLLGSRSYYEEFKELGDERMPALKTYVLGMLELAGFDAETAEKYFDQAVAFDALLVPLTYSDTDKYDIPKNYNPVSMEAFAAKSELLDLEAIVEGICGQVPDKIILDNPAFFDELDRLFSEESFPMMQSWMLVNEAIGYSDYLNEEARQLAGQYDMATSGKAEVVSQDKAAYRLARNEFDQLLGQYYGQTYFGEEARAEVRTMIEDCIGVYRERLEANDWLTDATKQTAVEKLDAMTIRVGWPEVLPGAYALYDVTPASEGGGLFENAMSIARANRAFNLSQLGQPVEKEDWSGMPAWKVNAFYAPNSNSINFPAAILQAPFYSPDQSDSANLGAIGIVIGHEITHAFDSSGSLFDKDGSMNNWWTEEDAAEFELRTQAMVELFDGIPYGDIAVNGALTKTENVADAGGISCALQLLEELDEPDYEAFFESYATIWREKMTTETANQIFLTDSHAPSDLRVNVQLGNCEAFCEQYGIQPEDGMYVEPERRVSIW